MWGYLGNSLLVLEIRQAVVMTRHAFVIIGRVWITGSVEIGGFAMEVSLGSVP